MIKLTFGEKKAMDCATSVGEDGVIRLVCRRLIKQKSGEMVHDGQTVEAFLDPDGCNPVITRGIILDDEMKDFDEQLKRFAGGCRRKIKKGISAG